jgi:hypothetical protein
MGYAEFEAALGRRRTWFSGARLAARVARTSSDKTSRSHNRSVKAVLRINDAVAVATFLPSIFMSAEHGKAVEQALFMRDSDHFKGLASHTARIKKAAQRCFGTAHLDRSLNNTAVGKALRLVALVPEFEEVLARCTMNQPPVLHKEASQLALDLYQQAVASGRWQVFVGLCRESPASLSEAWQLATLLSLPDADPAA